MSVWLIFYVKTESKMITPIMNPMLQDKIQ